MAYTPPTIAQTKAQIVTDIEGSIGQLVPILAKAFARVMATALSGVLALVYQFTAWVYKQISPITCDRTMLLYWGTRYNILPKEAASALLAVTLSGSNGSLCEADTLWQSADNGLVYRQIGDATIAGTTAAAQAECLTEGADGNLDPALALTLPSPVAGITGAVVASTVEAGVDAEATEDYRARILQRMRYQSIVGTAAGYVAHATNEVIAIYPRAGAVLPPEREPAAPLCHGVRAGDGRAHGGNHHHGAVPGGRRDEGNDRGGHRRIPICRLPAPVRR